MKRDSFCAYKCTMPQYYYLLLYIEVLRTYFTCAIVCASFVVVLLSYSFIRCQTMAPRHHTLRFAIDQLGSTVHNDEWTYGERTTVLTTWLPSLKPLNNQKTCTNRKRNKENTATQQWAFESQHCTYMPNSQFQFLRNRLLRRLMNCGRNHTYFEVKF